MTCEGYQCVLVPLQFSLKAILAFHLPGGGKVNDVESSIAT